MSKRLIEPVEGRRIRLRLLEEADLPLTLFWRNQAHIRKWFLNSQIITPQQHSAWFRSYLERDDDFTFIIEETSVFNRPVGQIAVYDIEWTRERGQFGRLMIGDPEAMQCGIAREATELLVGVCSRDLGLRELYLDVYGDNLPACAIYTRCGFSLTERQGMVLRMTRLFPPRSA
jgi:RimJ/RimL family protein N-acetyltransferase